MNFAQLTDTHLMADGQLAYSCVDTATHLCAAIDHLNAFRPRLDFVIISGDLVDLGDAEEYKLFRQKIEQLEMPYYVIPGNHDHRDVMRQAFADHEYLTKDGALQFSIEKEGLRIIGLDTTIPGEHDGHFDANKQAWLREELSAHKEQPTLVFMHHPPFQTGIAHMDEIMLTRANEDFWPVLQGQSQVRHIACGHVHRAIETFKGGIPINVCPSSAHQVTLDLKTVGEATFIMDPPAVRIFVWDGVHLINHLSFIGDYGKPRSFTDGAELFAL
ncbi:3',5'-cyclic adenosine monophosphate phosphodiesterase CpdA [Pseudovibrio axinellae]|uniref:3',5'-cyclic adenosine monophosphate phosphodiesterase CpdA n=1 Tax=Pseudovibrio axinellae TaxID=989403 RepID=A0A165T568_9HYPH|nr:phosphodiesterase [Pseudovibrio axinellae]KZL05447.1 3',5'-cyclic adenosine monophosphate phosphodiesterase CpdA [Pseudovibrio axinellae]SEP98817.1 3',5'-cyclic AMP phosphodiesterase CpdA [Pseudovibrio axinellae]